MDLTPLKTRFNDAGIVFKENLPLAPLTSFKIGGPADLYAEISDTQQLKTAFTAARELQVPFTVLGWGSNVLISDKGIRGIVLRLKTNSIKILNNSGETQVSQGETEKETVEARLIQAEPDKYYSFNDLNYEESDKPRIQVEIDAGVALQYAINFLIEQGITGLQWFSGIPGTIGGAIYNNIHGGLHFIFEFLDSIEILTLEGEQSWIPAKSVKHAYDYSGFQDNKNIIIKGKFNLFLGDRQKAKATSIAWAIRKKLQPRNSAGCAFQNITPEQSRELNFKSNGYGYIIDKILKLKGTQIGGARISEKHAAFIENTGNATAADVLALIRLVNEKSLEKIRIKPKLEIFLLGFSPEEIKDLT